MEQTFKLRKSKKFKNLCAVTLLSVTLAGPIVQIHAQELNTQAVTSTAADKNNPVYTEIPGEKTERIIIRTQQDLDNAIKRKGSNLSYGGLTFENTENLVFPAGVYKFDHPTYWLFPEKSKGNIDFSKAVFLTTEDGNFQWEWHGDHSTNGKNQEIKGLTAYCTPYGSLKADFTHETPKFNAIHNLLVHTQNVTFKDWTVNAGLYFGTHTFDIMGSSNIVVDNFTSQGLGVKAYTKEELEGINKNPWAQHSLYAEAVQIDYAGYSASGMKDWSTTGLWRNDKEDLLPSSNITIKNSTFKGYNGKTGDAIIKGTNDTINLPYGATIGSHYVRNQPYRNITITNNTFDNTINFGKNPSDPAIDPIHMHLGGKTTTKDDLKTWNVSGNQIINYEGAQTGNATIKRTDQYITWTESDKQKSQYLNGEALINNKQTIDTDITLEDGTVDNQNYRLVSWKKDGPYKLQTASNPLNESGNAWLPASVDNVKNEAKRLNTPILTTGGFWSYNRLDSAGPAKEIANGRTGYLVSDGNNNVQAKEYNPNESIVDMMKTEGSHGWNVGAFGAIVKDGKIADGYGGTKAWKNDPNEKTGRTIFLELNDGTQSILTIDGYASKKTGADHDQIVQILKNIGLDKIKLAFALDGGGSTRSYAKTDSGNESIVGSFVDNRPLGEFLYLTKNPTATPGVRTEKDANKVAKNESKSVDYNMFIEARNAGKEKIPGTNYDTGITYKDETKTDKVPFTTVYKANSNTEAGKKTTIQKGEEGVVTTKVTTKYVDGVKGESKSGTPETTKQAKDEIVEVGTKTKVETKTIPFERVTRDNDQLKQGETKVVQAGKDGKQTVTTTYELNTKTGEAVPKETTQNELMTPEIVERGTMKPVETKPSETKPSETKPSETPKPSETKPSDKKDETKPSETPKASDKKDETKPSDKPKPSETKPSETPKSSDKKDEVKPSETKPSETPKSSDKKDEVKPSETKPSETPKSSDKKNETKPSETPKPSETKPSDTSKSSDKKDEVKPSETPKSSDKKDEVKPSETPKSSDKKDESKPSETKPSDKKDEVKPSETPKSSGKKDESKPSESKPLNKKDDVKPSETKKSDESKSSENSDNNKSEESKPELTDKSDKSGKSKSETKKSEESKSELTDNSENSKVNESTPKSKSDEKSDVKPELTDKSKSSDNSDKPEVNESIPESKSDEKSDVKPDGQSSSLDNKSANSSVSQSAQNSSKQDLPKTNDVKVPLTISGIVLATAGFVALGYRKLFGKN